MVAQCTTPVATMHHSTGDDAPSSAVKLHFLIGVRKGHALKTGHVERDVAGGRGEAAIIVVRCGSPDGPRCARSGPPASATPPPFPAARSGVW